MCWLLLQNWNKALHVPVFIQICSLLAMILTDLLPNAVFDVITVHRLCRPGEYHSARWASEISWGLAKTLQFSVSRQTWQNSSQLTWMMLKMYNFQYEVLYSGDTVLFIPHDGSRVLSGQVVYAALWNGQSGLLCFVEMHNVLLLFDVAKMKKRIS